MRIAGENQTTYALRMTKLATLAFVAATATAQEPTPKSLVAPVWTAPEGLSMIVAVRELRDGRVLALDRRENRVVLVSSDGKGMSDIGRKGLGPGEYESPVALIALPGDSTAVLDQGPRRMLVLNPEAKPVSTMAFPADLGSMINVVRGADPRGRFLMPAPGERLANPSGETRAIIAWDRATDRRDTIATYRIGRTFSTGTVTSTTTYYIRYAPADDWVPLSSGRIAILHGEPYSADIVGGGGVPVRGPRIPYAPVDVAPSERIPAIIADKIPSKKPAFWGSFAMAGPDGDVWIGREMPARAATRRYDRFDRGANRTMSVETDKAVRIVGFGRAAMYTVRTDTDGLQWLEKRPLPR